MIDPSKKSRDVSKTLFYSVVIATALGLSFGYGLYSGVDRNWVYDFVHGIKSDFELVFEEAETISKTHPTHFLQPTRHEGSGVTVNRNNHRNDLIFLSGFFDDGNELRLIRRNGDIVVRWPIKFSEIISDSSHMYKSPSTDWNIDLHGALALSDGSVVFNFEYGGLVKLDRCGQVLWTLALPAHHSVELAEDGGFWVPGRNFYSAEQDSPFPPFATPFSEDTLMKISSEGVLISEISVPGLFYDNGLESLMTASGESIVTTPRWDEEIVHLNKIAELKSNIADDFPLFEAGDLILSLRTYNMIMVIDPHSRSIKWLKVGPWKRQHDPEFIPGGTITVFNNNAYLSAYATGPDSSALDRPQVTNIIEIDPVTEKHKIIYGGKSGQELLSIIRGKHEYMPDGSLLITEFEAGRILEIDKDGQVTWEYINRYSQEEVAEISEARIYPEDYFDVTNWSCDAGK